MALTDTSMVSSAAAPPRRAPALLQYSRGRRRRGHGFGHRNAVGQVETDPAERVVPGFDPGVAGRLDDAAILLDEMPRGIARRNFQMRAGQEDVAEILADAALQSECRHCIGAGAGGFGVEGHRAVDAGEQRVQRRQRIVAAVFGGEPAQCRIGGAQRRRAAEPLLGCIGSMLPRGDTVVFECRDFAGDAQGQGIERAFGVEDVGDVAINVRPGAGCHRHRLQPPATSIAGPR